MVANSPFPKRRGLSPEAQEGLFGRQQETDVQEEVQRGDSHSPLRTRRRTSDSEEVPMPEGQPNMEISSPAHLWGLGAVRLHFVVRNMEEVAAMVGQCQELWRNLEVGYADRLDEIEAIGNRVSIAQLELLEQLAEEAGEDLPEGYAEMSKGEASRLIDQFIKQNRQEEEPARPSRGGRRRATQTRSSRRSSSRRASRRSSGRRSSGRSEYDNDAPGSATSKQKGWVAELYDMLGEAPPEDLEDLTFNEASQLIPELEAEAGIER